jgi:hypothetical protein
MSLNHLWPELIFNMLARRSKRLDEDHTQGQRRMPVRESLTIEALYNAVTQKINSTGKPRPPHARASSRSSDGLLKV